MANFYGQQMLELNGRMDKDREMPKLTCKDRSTDDYFLSTVHTFPFIQDFDILHFHDLYSDAHCPITLSMDV